MDKDGCKFDCTMTLEETIEAEKGKYELGHDEITGEQKIIATVEYDSSTSKWKIINYEIAPQ
jgi:hypothetical protein